MRPGRDRAAEFVDIHACRLSFPCSVRYDSHQPGNSIVVAENWTGLRETATPFPLRPAGQEPGWRNGAAKMSRMAGADDESRIACGNPCLNQGRGFSRPCG